MCTRSSYYDIYMILHGTGTDTRPTWSITYGTVQHIYTRLQIGNLYSVETEVLKTDSFVTGILQPNIVQVRYCTGTTYLHTLTNRESVFSRNRSTENRFLRYRYTTAKHCPGSDATPWHQGCL
jgi:hypothetical protein